MQVVPLAVTVTLPEANPLWDRGLDGAGQAAAPRAPRRAFRQRAVRHAPRRGS